MLAPADIFELDGLSLRSLFDGIDLVWDVLDHIKDYTARLVQEAGATGELLRREGALIPRTVVIHQGRVHENGFALLGGDPTKGEMRVLVRGEIVPDATIVHAGAVIMNDAVHLGPGAVVEPGALIKGPAYIGSGSEVRQGAYVRGSCLVGQGCVVGHTTEMKNAAMLDGAKAGHFAYLGDSVLGREVNLGAGTKLANLKMINRPYTIKAGEETHRVTRRKFGAIIGDRTETGCNTVTNPGTILGPRCLVAPCQAVPAGYHPPCSVIR